VLHHKSQRSLSQHAGSVKLNNVLHLLALARFLQARQGALTAPARTPRLTPRTAGEYLYAHGLLLRLLWLGLRSFTLLLLA